MARTITEIKNAIIASVINNETLGVILTSTSVTAVWRLWSYIIAMAIWTLEMLFDEHKTEVEEIIANQSPHTLLWYRNKALAFQFGYSLPENSDEYEIIDEDAQIVAFAAATESEGYLEIKVAKDESGSLAELTTEEMDAFEIYIERIKDAGVKIRKISQEADHLRLVIDLYYDPLVLNSNGERLDGTNDTPLQDAIDNYLQNLPFNGEYSNMALTDAMQVTDGIKIVQLLSAEAYWGIYEWEIISAKYTPEAGWLKVYEGDLTINWIAYGSDL